MVVKYKRMVKYELIRDGQVVKTTLVSKTVAFNEATGNWTVPVILFEGRHTVEITHEGQTFTVKVCHLDNQLIDHVIDAFLKTLESDEDPARRERIHKYLERKLSSVWHKCVPCDVYMDRTIQCCPRCGSTDLVPCDSHGHVKEAKHEV